MRGARHISIFRKWGLSGKKAVMRYAGWLLTMLLFSAIPAYLFSQDISGTWKGKMYWKGLDRDTITAYFEFRKGTKPNHFSGISVCVNEKPGAGYFYGKSGFTCVYNPVTQKFLVKEDTLLESSSRATMDKYLFTLRPRKKLLTGRVLCDPDGPMAFLCGDTRIINLLRTKELPPIMRIREKGF